MSRVPKIRFNNGRQFPLFGLGTWQSYPNEVGQAVRDAIDVGYRHIDCAHVYQNEQEVGEAIAAKISEGVVKREDLYITSKLWNTHHEPSLVEPALRTTLKNLGLDYLDLYLIHWPFAFKEGDDLFPQKEDKSGLEFSDVDYVDTWKALEAVNKKGLAKSIGISNFNKRQIERILDAGTIVPATNQVECSPYFNQQKLLDYCISKGILLTAYSPLGSPATYPNAKNILEDPRFKELGDKYKKTPAQIVLRYQVQRGVITIPKSVKKSRLEENFNIFDFEISDKDMEQINGFDFNDRRILFDMAVGHKHYSFKDEY